MAFSDVYMLLDVYSSVSLGLVNVDGGDFVLAEVIIQALNTMLVIYFGLHLILACDDEVQSLYLTSN